MGANEYISWAKGDDQVQRDFAVALFELCASGFLGEGGYFQCGFDRFANLYPLFINL